MIRKRFTGTMAALGGLTAAVALLSGLPSAKADELADLKANQQLLEQRLDQLAQAKMPGNPYGVGSPAGPTTVQMMGGSFPRSFLIPGTDTSIRVGGEIRENALYWIDGGTPHTADQTGAGATGQINHIPLSRSGVARTTGNDIFTQSPQQSKLNFETRTPTPYGEARTFVEFDFNNPASGARPLAISHNIAPRLRYAYGTLGGFLGGQANSNFSDSDAGMETIDFSGLVGGPGHARVPQLRYTAALAQWGLPGALSVSAEQPETSWYAPATGVVGQYANSTVPLKSASPDFTAAWYIPQPWGHVDFSLVLRPTLEVNNGAGLNRTFVGYGGHFSGDVKPHWFGWDKDFIAWNVEAGDGIGPYIGIGNAESSIDLISNFGRVPTARTLIKPVFAWAGNVSYRHVWTPTVHSNIGVGIYHEDINGLNGAVCPFGNPGIKTGTISSGATGVGCGLNAELVHAVANIFWSPVSFVDVGLEYDWGHRFTIAHQRGDENVVEGRFRVRF